MGPQATEAMVTSVVLNDDVVPRMSAQSIEVLADQVRCGAMWCGGHNSKCSRRHEAV